MKKLPCAMMAVLLLCTAYAALAEDLRSPLYTYTVDRPEPVKIADFNITGMQMERSDAMHLSASWRSRIASLTDHSNCNNFRFPLTARRLS